MVCMSKALIAAAHAVLCVPMLKGRVHRQVPAEGVHGQVHAARVNASTCAPNIIMLTAHVSYVLTNL